jgi:hypothetical protein
MAPAPYVLLGGTGRHGHSLDSASLRLSSGFKPRRPHRGGVRVRKSLTENSQFLRPPGDHTIAARSDAVLSLLRDPTPMALGEAKGALSGQRGDLREVDSTWSA